MLLRHLLLSPELATGCLGLECSALLTDFLGEGMIETHVTGELLEASFARFHFSAPIKMVLKTAEIYSPCTPDDLASYVRFRIYQNERLTKTAKAAMAAENFSLEPMAAFVLLTNIDENEGKTSLPDNTVQGMDTCCGVIKGFYACTAPRGHRGHHKAYGVCMSAPYFVWPQEEIN